VRARWPSWYLARLWPATHTRCWLTSCEVTRTRSEWLTHLVDLGTGGTLGMAEGRTAAAEKDLLASHAATLQYLAMDLSATYRSGAPAEVTLVADAFHLVKLANRKIDDAFRRLGYRTEHPHEEPGLPRPLHYMLRYNIENLAPEHLATIIGVLDADADGQQIAAVWHGQVERAQPDHRARRAVL
jgi:Transposase